MNPNRTLVLALALTSSALAGCLGESGPATENAPPTQESAGGAPAPTGVDTGRSAADVARDRAPHLHNYWGQRDRVTLVDQEVEIGPMDVVFWSMASTYFVHEPMAGGFFLSLPENATVYEGTGILEVTVSWNDPTISGFKFLYRHAGTTDFSEWVQAERAAPVAIEVTPEMTDMPHATTSRWLFLFSAAGTPPVAMGKPHVLMEIVKTRDLTVYPGHPDRWNGATNLTLLDTDGLAKSRQNPVVQAERSMNPFAPDPDLLLAAAPVPMETGTITASLTIESVHPPALAVERVDLSYRSGDMFFLETRTVEETPLVSEDGLTWTWTFPVEMDQTDSPYADTSAWGFRVDAAYATPAPGAPPCEDGCYVGEMAFHLTVTASRSAPAEAPPAAAPQSR